MRLVVVFLSCCSVLAQSPGSWRDMELDVATIEDAVSILGEPNGQKDDQKLHTVVGDWLDDSKRFDRLEYKNLEGLKKAQLYFLDGKLAAVVLEPEQEINPNALAEAYGVQFIPKVGGLNIAFTPKDYGRADEVIYPKRYPLAYNIIGVAEPSFIVARVGRGTFSNFAGTAGGIQDDGLSFPGKVNMVQLVSRRLEDKRGLGVLN